MKRSFLIILLSLFIFLSWSCSLSIKDVVEERDIDGTISALNAQQTSLASTVTAISGLDYDNVVTSSPPQATMDVISTSTTAQVVQSPTLATPLLAAPTGPASPSDPVERQLKSARILLFENMSASGYIRIAQEALDRAGYFYLDVGSAAGWFKTQLLSSVDWDLIIAAAEADREFGGEFMGYIDQRVVNGAAAVIEYWNFDIAPFGMVDPLLNRCGVNFQADWFDPQSKALFGLQFDHPILKHPNRIPAGIPNAQSMWQGDLGDLFAADLAAASMESPPTLLIGTNPAWKNDHALLVSCLDGRLILQSFRTHEYSHDVMVALWENYIENALNSHFQKSAAPPPLPKRTAKPGPVSSQTASDPTPGPEYTLEHRCDEFFSVRFTGAPIEQRDLFEHHAEGTYMLLQVRFKNLADFPIMIWDEDYYLESKLGERQVVYSPDRAATGYLYMDRAGDLIQGVIPPGDTWDVSLAFDIDPRSTDRIFVFQPGSEFNEQVCEVRIPLER